MKLLSSHAAAPAKAASAARSPVSICMHVRGVARTDVRVMREATALGEAGFLVSIVDVEQERTRPAEENVAGVHVKHLFLTGSLTASHFKLWSLCKVLLSRLSSVYQLLCIPADMYHAHDVSALPACYIAARLRRKALIFDAHELPLDDLAGTPWQCLRSVIAWMLSMIVPACVGVITVSPPIAESIHRLYRARKMALVRNFHRYEIVPTSARLRQHLGLKAEVRIALYQGNIDASRRLDVLVRAASFLEPDIVIVMMGKGIGTTPADLAALITQEGVAERVKIIPPVPYEELLEWTASADIGLIPLVPDYSESIRMCLPNKLFEYLMAGLPVLTSQLDAVVDILRTHDVGQATPSLAPADLGAAINAMLADQSALARMRRNALEAAQRELCWEQESQQLVRFYHDILRV